MAHRRNKICPNCGSTAWNHPMEGGHHAGHALHAARHTGSPLLIGLTALSAGVASYRDHRFVCDACGHRFFGW